jgi:hypothetical protein
VELVVVNFRAAGKARRTTFNGRDYLVAPMTLIVPGVVPGSEGPLLYPLEELARNYQAWNYMPIVVNHPLRNGRHVSAREPAILEQSGVGFVFNASLDGRLRGEGWFDVERTRRVDARVLDRLERGEPLELSTGLYVDEEAAPLGAVWNTPGGPRPYRAVARNYRPDHLAVLPDQRGACAVDDGCGVLVNARGDQPVDVGGEDWGSYSREEILDLLTEAALESLDGPAGNAFDPNQPRDERGRFAGADAGGALPHGERQAQRGGSVQHARDFVTKGGPATHAEVGALADHLARLTVAQLHDLRREHGLPAQGAWKQRKPELVQTLAGRLAAHRATLPTAAARELTAAVKGNPAFVESKNKPSDAVHAYTHEGTGFRATAHPDGRFHVWDTGLSHQGTYHTATEAVAHAASPPAKSSPDYHQRTADVETAARQGAVADAQAAARAAGQNLEALHEGSKPLIQAASKVIGSAGRERVRQAFASTRAASEDSRLATTAQEHGTAARRHRQAANDHGAAVEFMRAHENTSNPAVSTMVGRHEEMVAAHRGAREHHLALADSDTVVRERRLETDRPLASTYNMSISARLGTQLAGFVSAGNEWPEFTTWARSLPPGEYTTLKSLSVNEQVGDAGALDNELRQAAVEAPPEADGAIAVAGRLLSILGDYSEPTGRLSVVANELSHSDLERRLEALLFEKYMPVGGSSADSDLLDSMGPAPYLIDVYDNHIVYRWMDKTYTLGYTIDDQTDKVTLDTGDPVEVARVTEYVPVDNAGAPTVNQLEYLSPVEACEVLSEGEFEGEELSPDEEEFLRERCSGFTANAGKGGLSTPDVTPEKACKILKDGVIRGKELTPRQRGLFGIICGRRKKPRGPARNHFIGSETQNPNHQTNFVANEREETSMRLTDEQRRIIVDNLVANTGCGCHGQTMPWPNERAALEKLTDNELAFADGCRKALVQNHASGPGGGSVATGPTAAQGAQRAGGGPTTNVVDPSQIVVPVATPVKAPANMAEALATYGTAQDREVWNSALAIHAHEKASVIETIVANVTGEARERLIARLQTKNIDELRELAVLGAQHRIQPQPLSPAVNWFGASAAAVAPPVQEEPLSSPVYSFERRSA